MKSAEKQSRGGGLWVLGVAGVSLAGCVVVLIAANSPASSSETRRVEELPLVRANRFLSEGRLSKAKAIFEEELKRDPKSVEAVRGMAMCFRDGGQDAESIPFWERLTQTLAPKDLAAWTQLTLAYWRTGRRFEAMSAAQTALSLSEGEPALNELLSKIMTENPDPTGMTGMQPGLPGFGRPQMPDPRSRMKLPQSPDPTRHLPRPRNP